MSSAILCIDPPAAKRRKLDAGATGAIGQSEDLMSVIRSKYEQGQLCDIIVKYGDQLQYSKKSHRLVLCAASDFFNIMLGKDRFVENAQGVVKLPLIEHQAVGDVLLDCIYGYDYQSLISSLDDLSFHIDVYLAADYCQVPRVKQAAADTFIEQAREMLRGNDKDVRLIFIQAAKAVYEHTPPTDKVLRKAVVQICLYDNMDRKSRYDPEFKQTRQMLRDDPEFEQALRDTLDLGADLIMHMFGDDD